jgi:hypothetical protein
MEEAMINQHGTRLIWRGRSFGLVIVVAALMVVASMPVDAADLSPSSGKFRLNIDTTLSWGARYRVEDRDMRLIGPDGQGGGGTAHSVNGDDGNLNFDKGIVSNTLKATVDVDYAYFGKSNSFGLFLRGSGFHDFFLEGDCCERTELTQEALDWAGSRTELLDAYVWWQFPRGEIRVGNQVLNWGESTFIQGGLSVINPVDVSALRVPGSELREAFRPLGTVWASFDLSENFSVEGFYQYEWDPIVIDPPGTYFSTNDFAGLGGETVYLVFGSFPDSGVSPWWMNPPVDYPFMGVPRGQTAEADDGGQYGLALRWFMPELGGTEFGLYYVNYHSRLPTINGVTGSLQGAIDAQAAGVATTFWAYYVLGFPPGYNPVIDATVSQLASLAGVATFANTANWFTAYPEDIQMYGLSWNAQLGTSGIAFQGELSYRQDNPLQVDDVELLFAALSPLSSRYANASQITNGTPLGFSETALGYRLMDTSQLQFTMTKAVSNILGADQGVFLTEFGFHKVFDMPSKDELRFEGPGTYTSGNPDMTLPTGLHPGKEWERPEHFADDFSWGYRFVSKLTYNNAIGAWSLAPRVAWQHDVAGVTPGPGGSFIEGRTAFTFGLSAEYQNAWQVDLSYTSYGGADRFNLINDRDFIGGFVKYSF